MNRQARAMRGVVLMGLMVLLAVGGLLAVKFTESAITARQREQEAQLLWVGQQFRRALESYYFASPGPVKHLPVSLAELVRDSRFPQPVRHLRRLYVDPLQPEMPWGLMRRGGQIIGVYSQSEGTPLRSTQLGPGLESLEGTSAHYSDWRFMFIPRTASGTASPVPAGAAPSSATTFVATP